MIAQLSIRRNSPKGTTQKVKVVSGRNGLFQVRLRGYGLRLNSAAKLGYRHFYEEDAHDKSPFTGAYEVIAWGQPLYKSVEEHPAVFIFVKEGNTSVSVLPCRGGYRTAGVDMWIRNEPSWPKRPSLNDVVYRVSSTQPSK